MACLYIVSQSFKLKFSVQFCFPTFVLRVLHVTFYLDDNSWSTNYEADLYVIPSLFYFDSLNSKYYLRHVGLRYSGFFKYFC
jgi:hypothetical protein